MKKISVLILLTLIGCSVTDVKPTGILEGKVIIGPLCGYSTDPNGVNPCGLSNEELDGIYSAYTVVASSETGNSIVLRKKLDRTGIFSFETAVGNYLVKLESSLPNALVFSDKESIEKSVSVSVDQRVSIELIVNTGRP
jgi:hypothetical protein